MLWIDSVLWEISWILLRDLQNQSPTLTESFSNFVQFRVSTPYKELIVPDFYFEALLAFMPAFWQVDSGLKSF